MYSHGEPLWKEASTHFLRLNIYCELDYGQVKFLTAVRSQKATKFLFPRPKSASVVIQQATRDLLTSNSDFIITKYSPNAVGKIINSSHNFIAYCSEMITIHVRGLNEDYSRHSKDW